MLRAMRAVLQAFNVPGLIALLPTIEGLGGDAKISAGKSGIVIMGFIVVKPFESLSGFF
jgi:hypothetical protein